MLHFASNKLKIAQISITLMVFAPYTHYTLVKWHKKWSCFIPLAAIANN